MLPPEPRTHISPPAPTASRISRVASGADSVNDRFCITELPESAVTGISVDAANDSESSCLDAPPRRLVIDVNDNDGLGDTGMLLAREKPS